MGQLPPILIGGCICLYSVELRTGGFRLFLPGVHLNSVSRPDVCSWSYVTNSEAMFEFLSI